MLINAQLSEKTKIQSIINIVLDLFSPWTCMKSRPLGNQFVYIYIHLFFQMMWRKTIISCETEIEIITK